MRCDGEIVGDTASAHVRRWRLKDNPRAMSSGDVLGRCPRARGYLERLRRPAGREPDFPEPGEKSISGRRGCEGRGKATGKAGSRGPGQASSYNSGRGAQPVNENRRAGRCRGREEGREEEEEE
jgi:hypothetical protein